MLRTVLLHPEEERGCRLRLCGCSLRTLAHHASNSKGQEALLMEISVPPRPPAIQSLQNTQRLMIIIKYLADCSGLLLKNSYNLN